MTDIASTSPYASKIKKPSPIKSSGIPKLAISPAKPTKLPTSKPVTRTVSASASNHSHSHTTGQLAAPVQSDDNPPNTPASPNTPSKSPNSARKSVGGTHRLYSPNAKESSSTASSAIPSYAKPTFANSTRLPYAGSSFASTAGVSGIPPPKSILKKPQSPIGVSNKAAVVTQRLTSTQPLPSAAHSRSASSTAARAGQSAGKHVAKQSSLALSSTNSRIPGYGSAAGSRTGSARVSAQSSARTSRQGSVGSTAAVPASPELASILAQAQAAQARVAEVAEEEAELHGRVAQRNTLEVHSRGHSRAASNASNVSNTSVNSIGSVVSPQSAQADSLLDEHDPLDDIDVDTSFDDVFLPAEQTEVNSAPLPIDESNEADTEAADGQPEQQQQEEEGQVFGGGEDEFAATDDTFDIVDPAADNNLIDTPFKPTEHEEKTQDADDTDEHSAAEAAVQAVDRVENSKQTVIITAPTSTAAERRPSNVHELCATPEHETEEKEDNSHKAATKPTIEAQLVHSTDTVETNNGANGSSNNTLALDSNNNAVTINSGQSHGLGVRKASISQSSDAAAPMTLDLLIGSTNNSSGDGQQDGDEYEEDEYEEDEEDGPAAPIVLSLNITIGNNGQIVQQTIQPVGVSDTAAVVDSQHDTAAKIELISDEQAETDRQQAAVEAAVEQASAETAEVAEPVQQAAQFTTIIIDRDTTGSYENTASPLTRTPAPTITEQPKQQTDDAPLDPTLLPTRTPAPSTAVPTEAADRQSAAMVIESPTTAFPSTLTHFDTLDTTRDQPSASTLEPAMRAPSPSTALPATASHSEASAVVKSVAFSDEVVALGEGKEERSESIDFGDDFSLPTTPMRGSVIDLTAVQPINSTTQPQQQADNTAAAAASINRLKQLEAERRAEEDKRQADEVDAKRQSIEKEAADAAERSEQQQQSAAERSDQQQQAEDNLREQLAESKRSLFAQMREGLPVTKLGKKGSPRDTRIFISEEEGQEGVYSINWDSKSKKATDAKMALADCRCVVGGEEGMFVHRKYAGKYDGVRERCVSVVSAVRGLDVVLGDEEAVNRLVAMLRLCGCPVRESS